MAGAVYYHVKMFLCCIAKSKLGYGVARKDVHMPFKCWCVLLTLLLDLSSVCFMQAMHDLMLL